MQYKLICFDMDGVIFRDINFWIELHKAFGTLEQGIQLTEKYLYTNYQKLVEEVVEKLWKGRDAKPYYDLVNSVEYLPGVKETFTELRKRGFKTAIISSSSIDAARRVQKDHGIDYIFANELVIRESKITGEFIWPIGPGKEKKAEIMKNLCSEIGILTKQAIYIGDSDNDIEAFRHAGLSIAFNSSSAELKKAATYTVDTNNLSDILKLIP